MTATCPRCDPRPIADQLVLELCDACRSDLDRYALVTAGAQRTPNPPRTRQAGAGDTNALRDVRTPTGAHAAVTQVHSEDEYEGGDA